MKNTNLKDWLVGELLGRIAFFILYAFIVVSMESGNLMIRLARLKKSRTNEK